jgi:hypothetical protein
MLKTLAIIKVMIEFFVKNKFEKSDFDLICLELAEFKRGLLSERFSTWISAITNQEIFIDPDFHGGGIHQGGQGSFLDMHADFNYHPQNRSWFRTVNILLYLNKDWKSDYAGQLKLVDGRKENGEPYLIEPIFNRAVIMFTRDYTLHGYDPINFHLELTEPQLQLMVILRQERLVN